MSFKLLHLSDLHLGQRFHDQDRSLDEDHALNQVVDICSEHAIDVVILAGDIFDTANPGAHETGRYHRFLARLVLEVGIGSVVIIAGNHDNASRIEGPRELYEQCKIHTVGSLRLTDDVQKCLIPLINRAGVKVGTCAAVPYLRDADVRTVRAGEDQKTAASAHREAVAHRLAAVRSAVPQNLPYVVTAHAFCTGTKMAGDERPIQVGNLGVIPAEAMAGDAAYLALGHLHRPQAVGGKEHWRYSGSMMPTGFDEIDSLRSIVIATIPENGPAEVEMLPLSSFRVYRSITGNEREVIDAVKALPTPEEHQPVPWAKVSISERSVQSGLQQYLTDLAQGKGWQLLSVQIKIKSDAEQAIHGLSTSAESPKDDILQHPDAVFHRLLKEKSISEEDTGPLQEAFASLRERCDDILEQEA